MFETHDDYDNFLERILDKGHVVVRKGFLQEHGYMDKLRDFSYEVIGRHTTAEKLEVLKERGFEKMHEVLSAQEMFDANTYICPASKDIMCQLVTKFVHETLEVKEFHLDTRPIVRFYLPYDTYKDNESLFDTRPGSMRLQGPHHDTWFGHAITGINVWVAIGPVKKGNGLSVYPEMWGKYLPHDGDPLKPKNESIGSSINFELEPGGALLFSGELMHASELNITNETRFVMTSRFSIQTPEFKYKRSAPWELR